MQIDFLKDIVSSVAGEKAKGIVDLLADKKNVNEFLIAKKLNLTINQTRNILYKLSDEGLVSFVRKKDNRKGGWYTYFWTLNQGKGLQKFSQILAQLLQQSKESLGAKKNARFYYSPNCNMDYSEESALLNGYICSECGEVLVLKDNSKEILALEKDISKKEALLKEVQIEIDIISQKEGKVRERRHKADEKKKTKERAEKRLKRQKEKKKGLASQKKKSSTKKKKANKKAKRA